MSDVYLMIKDEEGGENYQEWQQEQAFCKGNKIGKGLTCQEAEIPVFL
jgi:hypothetical protein